MIKLNLLLQFFPVFLICTEIILSCYFVISSVSSHLLIYNASWRCYSSSLVGLSYSQIPIFNSLLDNGKHFHSSYLKPPHFSSGHNYMFISTGPWKQGNIFNESTGKLVQSGGKKITPQKLLANGLDVLLHLDMSQSKFIR